MTKSNARQLALDLLQAWEAGKGFADELLARALGGKEATPHQTSDKQSAECALTMELFYGVLRQRVLLDWIIGNLITKQPRRLTQSLLRLGAYQLLFLDRVPPYAAVSETTKLARQLCSESEARFVNAVLRRISREHGELLHLAEKLKASQPAVFFSHPHWLFQRWVSRWGAAAAKALCQWNNTPPPLVLRVNQLRIKRSDFCALLGAEKLHFEPHPFHPSCVVVRDVLPEQVPGYKEGFFYVQDPSTLVAVEILDPQPGETVLDACAAPGGKTLFIVEKMRNRGQVVACDASAKRAQLLRQNCERLGAEIVNVYRRDFLAANAAVRRLSPDGGFDRILVDAPCSNTGVMRRRVDVRWLLRPEDLPRLAARQLGLLKSVAALLKEGGTLVYSTCSLEQEENEGVAAAFERAMRDFKLVETRSTFPPRDGVDGAFAAKFVRLGSKNAEGGLC